MQETHETWVRSLGRADPLEEEAETHSGVLVWESHGQMSLVFCGPWDRKESDRAEHSAHILRGDIMP